MSFGQIFGDDIISNFEASVPESMPPFPTLPNNFHLDYLQKQHMRKTRHSLWVLGQKLRIFTHCLHRQRSTQIFLTILSHTQPCRDCMDTLLFSWYGAADRTVQSMLNTMSLQLAEGMQWQHVYFIKYPYMPKGKSKCCQVSQLS